MNKIFKLLAVFMLFSALSAGSMTVQADDTTSGVAQIGEMTYATFAGAVAAANEAAINATEKVEIDLLADITLGSDVTIEDNITLDLNANTLDLNGYKLTISSYLVSNSGNVVDNSTTKTGFLKVSSDKCALNLTNSQIPVYDGSTGYAFATITHQQATPAVEEDDAFELVFRPYFGSADINALLAKGDDAKVYIGIRLTWTDANGNTQTKDLKYTNDMVKAVYAIDSKMAFYIKATQITDFANLTVTPLVKPITSEGTSTSTECLGDLEGVEYELLMKAYENDSTMKYSTDFGECTGGEPVPAKTLEEGEFYFCANNGTKSGTAQYGGNVTYENGYILMSEAWGQRIEVGPTSTLESDKKFCIVECKLRYNTPGINVNLMLRGVYNNKGKEYSLGTVENGIFTDATTGVTKTLLANEWYKFTYVLDINNKEYDLYIDEVKVTEESQSYSYFRGFQGDDFFRIKAANTSAPATGADFMIDDIKVYGCTTDPTAITTE